MAVGGQGEVFQVQSPRGVVLKKYKATALSADPTLERRLTAMVSTRPSGWRDHKRRILLAWPMDIVYDTGRFAGFVMPRIDTADTVELHRVANPSDRQTATGATDWLRGCTWRYLVLTAANLARATASLHSVGTVIGDFNERNVRVSRNAHVSLLDCDSMQIVDAHTNERFLCRVGRPEFTPPELLGADWKTTIRYPSGDLYALSIHIHQLLLEGEHPFRGVWTGADDKPSMPALASNGIWSHGPGPLSPRPRTVDLGILPKEIIELFRRAFEDGARQPSLRPQAREWYSQLRAVADGLQNCRKNPRHVYRGSLQNCPWCSHDAAASCAVAGDIG